MTHLIVHLVKINEARFLFDDIFSICTSSYVFSHEANEALSATLALQLPSLFSLCSKGKSQAFSCLMQLPFILQVTWSFLLDELLRYAKHKKSLSFEAFLREKVGGSLPKMKCHIENQRWTQKVLQNAWAGTRVSDQDGCYPRVSKYLACSLLSIKSSGPRHLSLCNIDRLGSLKDTQRTLS